MVEKTKVTVFGAGVAGLTAAHELVVRGFDVTVVDPEINSFINPSTLDRGIGGMARSQWVVDTGKEDQDVLTQLRPSAELLVDETVPFDGDEPVSNDQVKKVKSALGRMMETEGLINRLFVYIVFTAEPEPQELTADPRCIAVKGWLAEAGVPKEIQDTMVYASVDDDAGSILDPARSNIVRFRCTWPILPAEHGFRFFPSFYRHVFDTMKRTQILYPRDSDGGPTVYDNLVPVEGLGFARAGKHTSFLVDRKPVRSFEELRKLLRLMLEDLGWTGEDIARFTLKIFEYMTSSTRRRGEEYEKLSWSDFVDLPSYSELVQSHIEFGPQMLLSLRGSQSDARSQGTILTQLLLDQILDGTRPDATLGAPTSGAWFDHWHRFLLDQGVKFQRGKASFKVEGSTIEPHIGDAKCASKYYVLALPVEAMAELARGLGEVVLARADARDLHAITEFMPESETRNAQLRDMSGIQFYFDTEVRFWRGHTQYMDSEWGLTSISQPQFWLKARRPGMDYRSLLSVDIGIWDRPTSPEAARAKRDRPERTFHKREVPVTAWGCATPQDLASEVWAQIVDGHDDAFAAKYGKSAKFPYPRFFAVDRAIDLASHTNAYPFLVNVVGQYAKRPGAVAPAAPDAGPGYAICDGVVMAGTHMKTFTRITSMEAANESARHAVNAILQAEGAACDRCEIWNPEDNELPDLQWLRDLDAELCRKGLPHVAKIMGWSELPAMLLPHMLRNITERGARQ